MTTAEAEIREAFAGMSLSERNSLTLLDVAPRPDAGGKQGRAIRLLANAYRLSVQQPGRGAPRKAAPGQQLPVAGTVWHYDVQIEPADGAAKGGATAKPLPARLFHEIFAAFLKQHASALGAAASCLAFDGRRNAFSSKALPGALVEVQVTLPERDGRPPRPGSPGRVFNVKITEASEIDLDVLGLFCAGDRRTILAGGKAISDKVATAIQALDVLFKHEPATRFKVHGAQGRRFFDPNLAVPLPGGAEICKGFFQSVRPTAAGMIVNLDVAFSAFLGGGDFLTVAAKVLGMDGGGSFRGGRGGPRGGPPRGGGARGGMRGGGPGGGAPAPRITDLSTKQMQELRKRLRNVQVVVTHRPCTKSEVFKGFTREAAADLRFTTKDGTEHSLVNYFKTKYNYQIRFPRLPCIMLGSRGTCVPPECCSIVAGTPIPPMRLNPQQIEGMIRESAQRPADRNARVNEIRRDLKYESNAMLKDWGVAVEAGQLELPGRILPPPQVRYGQGNPRVNNGGWNLINVKFNEPGRPLTTWAVVNFTRTPEQVVRNFVNVQIQQLRAVGMRVEMDPVYATGNYDVSGVHQLLFNVGRDAFQRAKAQLKGKAPPPPQLFLCVLDITDQAFYDTIKRVCAMSLATPVPSQCVNARKAFNERGMLQYCGNVSMKINVKLGGFNQTVQAQDVPGLSATTMLIGADVTHAPPGSTQASIAASVATMNGMRSKWSSEIRSQRNVRGGSQEVLLEAESMFLGHLKRWKGAPATSIIVFRDGVSEGQYDSVVKNEFNALKNACAKFKQGYAPKVSYIVCAKRHHTRFTAANPADNDQRAGSLPAGTVVDSHVTHPVAFDIYLQAHGGLVGTPRPTHYVMVKDENGFTSDSFAKTINSLSYTFARATRATALVAPALYADILAEKGRGLTWEDVSDYGTTTSGGDSSRAGSDVDPVKVMSMLARSNDFVESQWYL